ncbi:MAG: glycosyltransferase, partial [Lachnospiraceae bacterium]|nr:glycosyltransferase [Lachnospiraceae bacterium]
MKIAMMTNNYKPFVAGVPVSIERLAGSLRAAGHEVVVFAPSYEGQAAEEDVVRYRALIKGVAGGFSVPDSLDVEIERRFREGNFDVIHVHHPMMIGTTARYLSWKYHVPLVFTYHTRYEQYLHYIGLSRLKRIMPAYIRSYTKHCDIVIAPTPVMKDYLEQIQPGADVRVLPTGIPGESFFPDGEKALLLRKKLAGDKKYLFCTVARLAKEKNLGFLLRCMKIR